MMSRTWTWLLAAATLSAAASGCRSMARPGAAALPSLKIVCLGDSITGQPNLRRYLKWSSILECMIEAARGTGSVQVLNRGIGGDSTKGARQRLPGDVLAERPDIVVVLLGGNDAGAKRPPADVKADLTAIVQSCKGVGAKVLLLQYHVIPNPEHPETAWLHLDDNNGLIAEVAAAEGLPLLDMGAAMTAAYRGQQVSELQGRDPNGVATWANLPINQEHLASAKDGVHLNPGGELVFARSVFAKLNELGWLGR